MTTTAALRWFTNIPVLASSMNSFLLKCAANLAPKLKVSYDTRIHNVWDMVPQMLLCADCMYVEVALVQLVLCHCLLPRKKRRMIKEKQSTPVL